MNVSLLQRVALITGIGLAGASLATAQDSGALLDLLVRKGIITDQEAEDLRADLVSDFVSNTSAGKLNLGSAVSEFRLSGDIRLRQQIENHTPQNSATINDRSRTRFRLRFNADALLQRGWGAGFGLETAQAADSANQTFEDGADDYNLYLARAYVSYRPNADWFFVAGKQRNPLYVTDLLWDGDINPQGLSEAYTLRLGAKNTLELRAAQFLMDDNNEVNPGPAGRDAWMFTQQAVYTHWFGPDEIGNLASSIVLAPGFTTYNDSVVSGLRSEASFNASNNVPYSGSTDKLQIASLTGEINFANFNGQAGHVFRVYWDAAYNFEAEGRVRRIYRLPDADTDGFAWLIGLGYANGSGKSQGDYGFRLDYRELPLGSIDPNINDSDFAFSNLNQRGWRVSGTYNLTDFANLTATYFNTSDIQPTLVQPAVARLDEAEILQLDLNVKF